VPYTGGPLTKNALLMPPGHRFLPIVDPDHAGMCRREREKSAWFRIGKRP